MEAELLEGQLSLEDVPFREAEVTLQVERGQDLPVTDDFADVRRVLGDGVEAVAEDVLGVVG